DIIDVAYRILKKMPIKVMMIGDGPDRFAAESRARELNISDSVTFLGKQENVYLLLSRSDLFLMPSRLESFGLAALEAMSCGVPCITSNAGGLPELVKDGISGFTADVGDVDKMAELGLMILQDDTFREKLSEKTRQYALDNFNVSKIIPMYVDLYQRALSSGK
ncbi:MAG: glycosyltransferase, partial [Calditrichia bacterium]